MARVIGYTLNTDKLAQDMGLTPSPRCLTCASKSFAAWGKVDAENRRLLGISNIPASQSGQHECRQCGKVIEKEVKS